MIVLPPPRRLAATLALAGAATLGAATVCAAERAPEQITPVLVTHEGGGAFMADAVSRCCAGIGTQVIVPAAGFVLLALSLWFLYPLGKTKVEENARILKERRDRSGM